MSKIPKTSQTSPHKESLTILVQQAVRLTELIGEFDCLMNQAKKTADTIRDALTEVQHRLADLMISSGKQRIRFKDWNISLRQEENVVVDHPDSLPDALVYVEIQTSRNPLWGKIRRRLKNGSAIPGVRLEKEPATVTVTRQK